MGVNIKTWLKLNIRAALSLIRQFVGLPHDKTRFQIRKIKEAFDLQEIEQQRITLIARATEQIPSTIQEYVGELNRPEWDALLESCLWNTHTVLCSDMMSARDAITLYALVRSLKPLLCVETGVGRGISAAHILGALECNGAGKLFSIDIHSPHVSHYGELIPVGLRQRWELRIQQSMPLLPVLFEELGSIDFFLHDSDHTFHHMTWEYELAWHYLRPGGCLASHDVVNTTAFFDFGRAHVDEISLGEIIGNFGFLIRQGRRPA